MARGQKCCFEAPRPYSKIAAYLKDAAAGSGLITADVRNSSRNKPRPCAEGAGLFLFAGRTSGRPSPLTREEMIPLARRIALAHDIQPPELLCALAHHESHNWQPWALRYEPGFYDSYISHMKGLTPTEKQARAFSYGLCQLMGQTARELGFAGDFLSELCDPAINLEFGARYLKKCLTRSDGDVVQGLLHYNGGGNPDYPKLVLAHLKEYTTPTV